MDSKLKVIKMKSIIIIILLAIATTCNAATVSEWCWCGSGQIEMYGRPFDGIEDCVSVLRHPTTSFPINVEDTVAADHGFCRVNEVGVEPTSLQKKENIIDTLAYPYIERNWDIVAKTEEEINQDKSLNMDTNLCMFIKLMLTQGKITSTDVQAAPQELKDAYLATDALGLCD